MTDQTTDVNPFEGWVTLQEAARMLGREHSTLRYWANKGYIRIHQIGKRVKVVNFAEVKAYSETHQPHGASFPEEA